MARRDRRPERPTRGPFGCPGEENTSLMIHNAGPERAPRGSGAGCHPLAQGVGGEEDQGAADGEEDLVDAFYQEVWDGG